MNVTTDLLDPNPAQALADSSAEASSTTARSNPDEFTCSRCAQVRPLTSLARVWRGKPVCLECVMA